MTTYLVLVLLSSILLAGPRPWGPALAAGGGLLFLLRSRRNITKSDRLAAAPLLGMWIGRLVSSLVSGLWHPVTGAALAAPLAFRAALCHKRVIPRALQVLGLWLAATALGNRVLGMPNGLLNRNLLAGALLPCLAAWLPRMRRPDHRGMVLGGLAALAICSTLSRGAILAMILMAGYYFRWLRPAVPLAVLAAPLLLQLRWTGTLAWRVECWQRSLLLWLQSPWLGIGPGLAVWQARLSGGHAHNLWLGALAWTGLAGFVLLVGGQWLAWWTVRGGPRWALAGLLGCMLHNLVDDLSWAPLYLVLVALLLAAAVPDQVPRSGPLTTGPLIAGSTGGPPATAASRSVTVTPVTQSIARPSPRS